MYNRSKRDRESTESGSIDSKVGDNISSGKAKVMSAQDIEGMADVEDLLSADGQTPLNSAPATIRRLISPLQHLELQDWPLESNRVNIITQLEFDVENLECDMRLFFEKTLPLYLSDFQFCAKDCLRRDQPSVHISEICKAIQGLVGVPIVKWPEECIERCVATLRGRSSIDARGARGEDIDSWFQFAPTWLKFVSDNPRILRIMDPFWVVINVVGTAPTANLLAAIAAYPLVGSTAPPLNAGLDGCPYYIPFASHPDARHFAGYIKGACGLHSWVTSTNCNPPVYM